jgi:hypothetical protein
MGFVVAGTTDDLVRRHVADFWRGREQEEFEWTAGPIGARLPDFRVRRIAPAAKNEPWVYATVGAWRARDSEAKEFVLLAPAESPAHVETLTMIAFFHADRPLDVGSTVRIGRPWTDDGVADHLLVSLPYPFGPALEHLDASGTHVRFLWLVPITAAEADYRRERGLEALEQLMEAENVNVVNPLRRSLV